MLCPLLLVPVRAQTQTYFEDQFNAPFNTNDWTFVGSSSGGSGGNGSTTSVTGITNFNFKPSVQSEAGVSFARLRLDTYNPHSDENNVPYAGRRFKGTEMYSRFGFGPPGRPLNSAELVKAPIKESPTGFEFETRMRYTSPQAGGWGAFWTYWNHGQSYIYTDPQYSAHEIDYEMFASRSPVNHNVYDLRNYRNFNASPERGGGAAYGDPNYTVLQFATAQSVDYTQWHYLKIVWTPLGNGSWRTQWYVKRNMVDPYQFLWSDSTVAPDKWMTVRFNIWNGGDSSYGPGVPPVNNAASNTSFYLDVDWVKVTAAPAQTTSSLSVTQANGAPVSNGQTLSALNSISGTSPTNSNVNTVNVVITRFDGAKWRGYGSPGWSTTGDFGIATTYNVTTGNWTTSGTMPTPSQLPNGGYTLVADAFNGGTYLSSSAPVNVNIVNSAPISATITSPQPDSVHPSVPVAGGNTSGPVSNVTVAIWRGNYEFYKSNGTWSTGYGEDVEFPAQRPTSATWSFSLAPVLGLRDDTYFLRPRVRSATGEAFFAEPVRFYIRTGPLGATITNPQPETSYSSAPVARGATTGPVSSVTVALWRKNIDLAGGAPEYYKGGTTWSAGYDASVERSAVYDVANSNWSFDLSLVGGLRPDAYFLRPGVHAAGNTFFAEPVHFYFGIPAMSAVDIATPQSSSNSRVTFGNASNQGLITPPFPSGFPSDFGPVAPPAPVSASDAGWNPRSISVGGDSNSRVLWTKDGFGGSARLLYSGVNGQGLGFDELGTFTVWKALDIATNSTNKTHILWTNTSNQLSIWRYASGTTEAFSQTYGGSTDWKPSRITAAPDGGVHVLWWNETEKRASFWIANANGDYVGPPTGYNYGPFGDWRATDIASANMNNSTADPTRILWVNAAGDASIWRVSAQGIAEYSPIVGRPQDWNAVSISVSSDGVTRLLWRHTAGRAWVQSFGADMNPTSPAPPTQGASIAANGTVEPATIGTESVESGGMPQGPIEPDTSLPTPNITTPTVTENGSSSTMASNPRRGVPGAARVQPVSMN